MIGALLESAGLTFNFVTSHPQLVRHFQRSPEWAITKGWTAEGRFKKSGKNALGIDRSRWSYTYAGPGGKAGGAQADDGQRARRGGRPDGMQAGLFAPRRPHPLVLHLQPRNDNVPRELVPSRQSIPRVRVRRVQLTGGHQGPDILDDVEVGVVRERRLG